MPRMQIAGAELFYEDECFADPWRDAPTVLLHHGVATSGKFWYPWVPTLLVAGFRVVRIDSRGWGRSPVAEVSGITFDRYVADVVGLLDHLGVPAVHFCGQSFGGTIGVAVAARHAERVATLTLVAAPVRISPDAHTKFAFRYASESEAMRVLGSRGWVEAGEKYTFPDDVDPQLREWFVKEMGSSDVRMLMKHADDILDLTVEPLLPDVACPTLVLYPEEGDVASSAQRDILATGLRDVKIVLLPGRAHAIASLFPLECAQHLVDFIGHATDGSGG